MNGVVEILMKSRKPPLMVDSLSAAIRRIVPNHEKERFLQSRLAAIQAGYAGELVEDRIFENYEFSFPYMIFHDLALYSSSQFQIDTLFITSSHAVVLEVKNIAGALTLRNNPPQLIRTLENGQTASFESPVSQLQWKIELLQDWFAHKDIHLTVIGAVVLALAKHPVSAESAEVTFLYPTRIPSYLRRLSSPPSELRPQQFSLLSEQLLQGHRDFIPKSICESYTLTSSDFRSGFFL
ncbi:nuclease-related domain-containing protein [Sporosarcina sp. A2]|uniref:nuclease-related domain-containing protein n=1 Tax=Sporosarcina sp. A2 TaxID=3393449 RepID=UPI003D7C0F56